MIKLVLRYSSSPYNRKADVENIIAQCAAKGFEISFDVAIEAWEAASSDNDVEWMEYPHDASVVDVVLEYTKVEE